MNKPLQKVDRHDLALIAKGSAILGAGGGGDPYIGRLMVQQMLSERHSVDVVQIEDLAKDALILPIAMMGAPQVTQEKFPSGKEIPKLIEMMERLLQQKVEAILCIEAGGLNSTIPFIAAAQMGLPIVDADAMGRAFPELQMVTLTLGGMNATPMAIVDDKGNAATFEAISNVWSEKIARALTIEMGGGAMVSLYPIIAGPSSPYLIKGSLSMAHRMGQILDANGGAAAQVLAETFNGVVLFTGRVRDVERRSEGGFTRGELILEGQEAFSSKKLNLSFQNEFLAARIDHEYVATTPDLITLLDANTGMPITTELVKYGLSVHVLGLPCAPIWQSDEAIDMVGPRYFGIDVDYQPLAGNS
ncbi:MAG: DUF917 domain-containing protein [Pseudomonadota bacterium]|nr:DUF917 domain-containing protein [Pseudomonadota bacterium]